MRKTIFPALLAALVLPLLATLLSSASSLAQTSSAAREESSQDPEAGFQQFLKAYWPAIKERNHDYLRSLHPKLPEKMYDFFFNATLDMMRYSEKNEGVEPTIECQDFSICKVVYPQPNDSWAAQRFILHEDA